MATFRKTKSGKWEVRVAKKGHKPLYGTFRTKAQAETWARKKEDMITEGTLRDYALAERTSVAAACTRYLEEITPRKASESREASRIRIISTHLGHLTLKELTADEVIGFVDERLDDVVSDTVRKELGTLSQIIKTARALWQIKLPENPVTIAREILSVTRTLKPGVERIRRLQPKEYKLLLQHAPPSLVPIIRFAIETGMRRGELTAAKREHVKGSTLHIPETKTQKPRTIPLSRAALRVKEKASAQLNGKLFGLTADAITKAYNRACADAGIKDLRFHDLRHEAISRFFERGLEIQEVAAISGHSDWKSLKRYTHVLPENIAKKLA